MGSYLTFIIIYSKFIIISIIFELHIIKVDILLTFRKFRIKS
jgi:hypothetical protein